MNEIAIYHFFYHFVHKQKMIVFSKSGSNWLTRSFADQNGNKIGGKSIQTGGE